MLCSPELFVCCVSLFGFEDEGVAGEEREDFFVTHLLASLVPRKDALRIHLF